MTNATPPSTREISEFDWTFRHELTNLESYSKDFAFALQLFDYCQAECNKIYTNPNHPSEPKVFDSHKFTSWQFIAARDGAMSIYHFGKTYEDIRKTIKENLNMFSYIDDRKLKESGKLFRELFPNFEAVRHAVAHAGDLDDERHAASIPERFVQKLIIKNKLYRREFSNTFEGEIQSYSISKESLNGLNRVEALLRSSLFINSKPLDRQ